jgi:hypothetical protein
MGDRMQRVSLKLPILLRNISSPILVGGKYLCPKLENTFKTLFALLITKLQQRSENFHLWTKRN